jgi:hypothetical protein
MNLALALIDERDRLFSFIGERKGMLTGPLPPVLATIVLGRQQLIAAAEGLGEVAPLASTSTLRDSHIPTLVSEPKAFDAVDEAIKAAGHGLGAWWLIVAIPAAEPCSDP